MSAQVELFRAAKREIRLHPELTDQQVAAACGVPQHILSGWADALPEAITIASARREIREGL